MKVTIGDGATTHVFSAHRSRPHEYDSMASALFAAGGRDYEWVD